MVISLSIVDKIEACEITSESRSGRYFSTHGINCFVIFLEAADSSGVVVVVVVVVVVAGFGAGRANVKSSSLKSSIVSLLCRYCR